MTAMFVHFPHDVRGSRRGEHVGEGVRKGV